jgi:phosphoribosylformylglycinamidine synthase subunit PurS
VVRRDEERRTGLGVECERVDGMRFDCRVNVQLRPGIADPQGSTIERALPALGFDGVSGVRVGKSIQFQIEAADEAAAHSEIDEICQKFLTNPVIEDATVAVVAAATESA